MSDQPACLSLSKSEAAWAETTRGPLRLLQSIPSSSSPKTNQSIDRPSATRVMITRTCTRSDCPRRRRMKVLL